MSIKGLKEALAKRKAQPHPDAKSDDASEKNKVGKIPALTTKPLKKNTGRGR